MAATDEPELLPTNSLRASARRRRLSLAVLAVVCAGLSLTMLFSTRAAVTESRAAAVEAAPAEVQLEGRDFSRFTHTNPTHARLPCLLCHRRETNAPQPRRPGHTPCTGCHTQQFADQSSPICTICHTNPPAKDIKAFPPLRSFNARFDHARHTRGATANCATCHRPVQRGVALSIPAGASAHATCYQCHGPRAQTPSGRDLSSCGTCHTLGRLVWSSTNAPAYRVNFSHAKHAHPKLACADCHNVRAGAAVTRQVSAPAPLMHHAPANAFSCAACHNGKRAFGGDDFTVCTRCHQGTAWHF